MTDRKKLDALRADKGRLVAVLTEAGATFQGDKVRCPFHDDAHPSAGVYEIDGGWRFTCQACDWNRGKKTGDVVDVVRTFHKLDFAGACSRLGLNGSAPSNGRARTPATRTENRAIERNGSGVTVDAPENEIEAPSPSGCTFATVEAYAATHGGKHGGTWTYANLDGSPAMAVVRINEPKPDDPGAKRFIPLHPTAGGWSIGDPPDKLPLYRLPELVAADCVYVVEGEKAADAARTIGLVATTSSHGSGSAEKTDWTPLAGKQVVVLPDNDDAGRTYAKAVARILGGLNPPATVRVVELPGLPDKGDIVQFLDARECQDSDDIRRGIEALADPWAGTRIGDRLQTGSLWEPVTYIPTGLRWFDARTCGGLVTGGVHMVGGKTGSCKTQVASMLAGNAARAGTPTAYLSLELNWKQVTRLIVAQRSGVPRNKIAAGNLYAQDGAAVQKAIADYGDAPLWIFDDKQWPHGPTRDVLGSVIRDGVRRFGWKLVVIDYLNLIDPNPDDREQFTTDLRNSTTLKKLACEHDIALLVVASVRKGGTYRSGEQLKIDDLAGAGRLAYDSTNVFFVTHELGSDDCGIVKIRPMKMRFAPCDDNDDPLQFRWRPRTGLITDLEGAE